MSELSERAVEIKKRIDAFLAGKDITYNSDVELVNRILNGLAKREEKYGELYCPCRLVSGDAEKDKAIVCPCDYHEEEIREKGVCYCGLLVRADKG